MLTLRSAGPADLDLLWAFLAIAAYEPDATAARRIPVVAAHLAGWQREGDFGVIAERDGVPVGAAWARQFTPAEEPTVYVDASTPEISIAVRPEARSAGIGTALLEALQAEARRRGVGLCLNVRDTNPAIRLYERLGYRRIPGAARRNRVGGWSLGIVWTG